MLRRSNRGGPCRSALTGTALLLVIASALACDRAAAPGREGSQASSAVASGIGRYRLQVLRTLGNPKIYRFDTATGELTISSVQSPDAFTPMTTEAPPGLDDPIEPGRFTFDMAPGRGGPTILRTDTVSGRVWLLHAKTATTWLEIDTGRVGGAASEQNVPAGDALSDPATPQQVLLPQDQPPPTPKLAALQHMLDSDKTTPELRAWAVGELAKYYPGETQRILAALQGSEPLVVVAAIEAVDLQSDERYESTIKGLRGNTDAVVAAAAQKKLGSAN